MFDFAELGDEVAKELADMGMPQYRKFAIRKIRLAPGALVPSYQDYAIEPNPKIESVTTKLLSQFTIDSSLQLSQDDFVLKRLSRRVPRDFFHDSVEFAIVDYVLTAGRITSGIKCKIIHVDDTKPTRFDLLLQRYSDKLPIAPVPFSLLRY